MSDEQAIANCIFAYASGMDRGDFDGVGELLGACDVTFEGNDGVHRGAAALSALYAATTRRYDDGTPKTKHVTTNVAIVVDGNRGSASSYFTVFQAVPGVLALQPIIAGRYDDTFARVGESWRFASRHVSVDLLGDLSAHLTFTLTE
jgi:hypothetical protein